MPGARLIAEAARLVAAAIWSRRPEPPCLAVPRTPFNGPISAERRFAFGSVSLKDVKHVAKANGTQRQRRGHGAVRVGAAVVAAWSATRCPSSR